ncbi:dihydroneopterin aldolase [Propionibacterium cyclohexanicum]|uniref:7,8-dihydroneopterin aldolase n=1 Tax=Propionibacterium cyclohexanicum TaxID=64702 RepID=A0A1H9RWC6_9ACTN|nr:dihydroneopterin aldolase [Propionibacterium cyclohexanicum]SER76483.1 dihydroneopterin aldolase [Propionibacterium cyclohexanicum]
MAVAPESGFVVVRLSGISAIGHHGVLAHEKTNGQPFVVDISMLVAEPVSDELSQTVDYSKAARVAAGIIESAPVNLIETLAGRIAEACLGLSRVREVEVTVHKPHAPIEFRFDDVSATVHRRAS